MIVLWGRYFVCGFARPGSRGARPGLPSSEPVRPQKWPTKNLRPWIVLPHFPAPGAKRLARPHGVEPCYPKPSEDVDSRAGPPWTVRRNVSFRAIHEGQRMAYSIARWVAESGLTRPVNHVFDASRVGQPESIGCRQGSPRIPSAAARGIGRRRWRRCGQHGRFICEE